MDTKDLLNDSSIHHGRNLVRLMNRKGLKVEDLEKALQLSQKQVEELMEMKKIDDEMLDKLAKALDVSVETIKSMKEEEPSIRFENNTFNINNDNGTNSNIVGQTNNNKYDNVSFSQIIDAYRLMLKQEREEVHRLQKRIDELEKQTGKQKNQKPKNE